MPEAELKIADFYIAVQEIKMRVRELHNFPDLPEAERRRLRSAVKITKSDIEDFLNSVGEKS